MFSDAKYQAELKARGITNPSLKEMSDIESALYRRHHGEFEARDSASRMGWDAEKRQTVRPYSSEIEPKGGWIVR
jgi:hypothetical protein